MAEPDRMVIQAGQYSVVALFPELRWHGGMLQLAWVVSDYGHQGILRSRLEWRDVPRGYT